MKLSKNFWYVFLFLLLVGFYIGYKFGFGKYFTLDSIKANSQYLANMVQEHYLISVILYIIIYFFAIATVLPSTPPLSMLGGFLFGVWPTAIYSTIAATLGASVTFFAMKIFFKATVEQKYGQNLQKLRVGVKEYGSFYLLLLHFAFIFPFFMINTLAVLAGVSYWQFFWTTLIGFIPCTAVYAFSGKKLLTVQSFGDIFSWQFVIAVLLLIVIGTLPIIIKIFSKKEK